MQSQWNTWWIISTLLLITNSILADVRLPPYIHNGPDIYVSYRADDDVRLPCGSTGIPTPSYKWLKDGVDLEMNTRIDFDPASNDGSIIISNAMAAVGDNGEYQCVATNPFGVAMSGVATVEQQALNYISNDVVDLTPEEGQSLKLSRTGTLTSVPDKRFDWKMVFGLGPGTLLRTNQRIALDQTTGSLYFANVLTDDQLDPGYRYILDVTNFAFDGTQGGSPHTLTVTPNPDKQNRAPSRMIPEGSDDQVTQIALKGETATLKCFFEGLPTPTVSWTPVPGGPPPSRIDCTQESGTECLITSLEYEDEAIYPCAGTNSEGSAAASINLIIQSIPTFTSVPKSVNATGGSSQSFLCIPDAVPMATITWYSNGEEITRENPGSERIVISEDKTNLTVLQVCKDCEGDPLSDLQVFQCKVENEHGTRYASAYLNVLDAVIIYDKGEVQDIVVDPQLGEKVEARFTCRASADALFEDELEIKWYYKDNLLTSDDQYTITNNGENIEIDLTELTEGEWGAYVGVYTCRADAPNGFDEAEYSFNIKLNNLPAARLPPLIEISPPYEVIYKQGVPLRLPCTATGIPEPTYMWLKDGEEMVLDERVYFDTESGDGSLIFSIPFNFFDDGSYQCIAENQFGKAFSHVIALKQADLMYATPNDPIQVTVTEGEGLALPLHDSLSAVPEYSFQWKTVLGFNAETPLSTNSRIAVDQSTGTLYMANTLIEDELEPGYQYKLDVSIMFLDVTMGGSPYVLTVIPNPDKQDRAPERMLPAGDDDSFTQVVLKGSDVTLKCFFQGLPTPTVSWTSPEGGPPPSRIDCTKESGTECQITSVEEGDAGTYTCMGSNTEGSQDIDINLVVQSTPTFTRAPVSVNATIGSTRSFLCVPEAVPAAAITWYSDGVEITRENAGSKRIILSEDMTNLTIQHVCKDCTEFPLSDLQVFQCKVENEHGTRYASAYLNVIEPVDIFDKGAIQDINIDPESGEKLEATFTCRAAADALLEDDLEIKWFHIGCRLSDDDAYTLENNGEVLHINLTGLHEEAWSAYVGEYTCRAEAGKRAEIEFYSFNVEGYEELLRSKKLTV